MNKVFVTGASGFIGKRLVTALLADNVSVRVLSRHDQSDFETVICDLQNASIPSDALTDIDTVFHLAAFAHDLRDATNIEHLYRLVNVSATEELLRLATLSGVQRFIFVSSVKAGGHALSGQCISESDQDKPEGVYGQTKYEAELKVLQVGRQSGMHVSVLRPSLVYGNGVKGNLSNMFSAIKKGWFPPLPETGNNRSMVHVDDLVSALLLVCEDDRADGEIFNVTDGNKYSSREIYETMCSVLGKKVPSWSVPKFVFYMTSIFSPRLAYMVEKLLGDECYSSEKIRMIGFSPSKTLENFNT
jgi:UDP-glucose 4-epimerase